MSFSDPFLWVVNGLLAVVYMLLDHVLLLVLIPPAAWLVTTGPPEHRPWVASAGALALLAGALVPPPVPLILAMMAWAGLGAVRLDRFSPKALRWRVSGGIALYALAALGFAGYAAYTSRLDPQAWSAVVAGGEAASVVEQGRAFLSTIAVWGLWVILPLGYLALLLQGVFVHPPTLATPAAMIHSVRGRGYAEPEPRFDG